MKRLIALLLCFALCLSLAGCKSKEVTALEEAINAIGKVTLDSGDAIAEAEEMYDALEAKDQEKVENYDILTDAREEYEELCDEAAVDEVVEAIDAIGTVTLESADAIAAARDAYNNLRADLQGRVGNRDALIAAEGELSHLEFVQMHTITNYGYVSPERPNLLNQDLNTWYTNQAGRAMLGLMYYLELTDDDGPLEPGPYELTQVYVAVNWEERFVETVFVYSGATRSIQGVRYWPDAREAQYGHVDSDMEITEWLEMMVEAGVYDEYTFVPIMDMYQILQYAGIL